MLCSRSARAVVHVRRVLEVAVHPAVDLGRERHPRVALVREVPDEGPEGLLGARLEVADGQKKTRCLLTSSLYITHTPSRAPCTRRSRGPRGYYNTRP